MKVKKYCLIFHLPILNKVILFVGDGMGDNHISITEAYYEKEMFFTSFEKLKVHSPA